MTLGNVYELLMLKERFYDSCTRFTRILAYIMNWVNVNTSGLPSISFDTVRRKPQIHKALNLLPWSVNGFLGNGTRT